MATRKLFLSAVVLSLSTLPAIAKVSAQDHNQTPQERRYYDSVHRDYHTWNGDEDRRYREFVTEQHRKYKDFSRLSKKDQGAYWQWRHDHEGHEERR